MVGIRLRRRDQLKADVVWGVPANVIQRSARFGLSDSLEVQLDHIRMPAVYGKMAEKKTDAHWMSRVRLRRSYSEGNS